MKIKLLTTIAAILAVHGFMAIRSSAQSVPNLINYQGRLTDQTGAALPQGLYQIQFRLWDSPTATNSIDLIWGQQYTLAVQTNGVFATILGSGGTAISGTTPTVNDLSYAFTQSNRFFGLTVISSNGVNIGAASEIMPRQQFLSVPFAIVSSQASIATHALDGNPPGTILAFGGSSAPAGFLFCDGSSYSVSSYPSLYATIGTTWGQGSSPGSTFNVPDLRSKFPLGAGQGLLQGVPLSPRILAQNGGEETHKLIIAEMPNHSHEIDGTAAHYSYPEGAGDPIGYYNGRHEYTGYTASAGGDQPHNTMPPFAVVNYIIKY